MNTNLRANSAHQNPQIRTVSFLFNLSHHRQPIAQGISGTLAMRFKRRFPACIVKFSGFEGGAL